MGAVFFCSCRLFDGGDEGCLSLGDDASDAAAPVICVLYSGVGEVYLVVLRSAADGWVNKYFFAVAFDERDERAIHPRGMTRVTRRHR